MTRRRLLELGVRQATIDHQLSVAGSWQWVLPGTYLLHRGPVSTLERLHAALAYCGPGSLLTGPAALRLHGLPVDGQDAAVDVLVPHERRRRDTRFVRVERTRRPPEAAIRRGLPCTPVARAIADACRYAGGHRTGRALVASGVQRGACTVQDLHVELRDGPTKHSALLRRALAEVGAGVRSIAEADARQLLLRARLPEPRWNVDLFDPDGTFLARPDAYWPNLGVAWQIDSREWHVSPESWETTLRRHGALTTRGVSVLHTLPSQVAREADTVAADLSRLLRLAGARPAPALLMRTAR